MSTENDVKDILLDPETVKSDKQYEEENVKLEEYIPVKCTEPLNPTPIEFKGSVVITCCPHPETKHCDDCNDKCSCDKKKCDCVDCKCDNCQCEKKTTDCSYFEKLFPCFYHVNVSSSEPTK